MLSFGKYPSLSLVDARARRTEAESLMAKGLDPKTVVGQHIKK